MVDMVGGHGSLIGTMLGEYEVEALIGRGAMGSVYLARDTKLNRLVALKVLLGSLARTPSLVKQFHLEAQAAAPLNHPGIVRIYSAGIEDGTPYIAMEFVDGEPLDRFLKRHGKITWEVALQIGSKVAKALDAAHHRGVVHRDVKPSNIMLDRKGGVRLTDFGIASIQSEGEASSSGTNIIGTPQYMSPEQVTGQKTGPSTDLFALGVTVYQMIAGEMPFRGESSMALIKSICEDDPPRLNKLDPSIPDDVARLVAYLMEKDPAARPANAKVVYGLIHRLQKQRGGTSAVSESLTSFLKEEMEARPFSGLEPSTSRSAKTDSGIRKKSVGGGLEIPWAKIAQGTVIAVLAIGSLAIGPVVGRMARESSSAHAPNLAMASFQPVSSGIKSMYLYTDGYELGHINWVGDKPVAVVEVRGLPGGLTDGMTGLLSIDPAAEQVLSLHPPRGVADSAAASESRSGGTFGLTMPKMPPESVLADSFLVHTVASGARPYITLAQRWDSAVPEARILFRASAGEWSRQKDSQWAKSKTARAILSPDGNTLCMVLYDEDLGHGYLVERDIRQNPPHRSGERRTTVGANVIPESVQYSPDGSKIAYLRHKQNADAELWLLQANGIERNGYHLASGVVGTSFSFSPDGRQLAILMRDDTSRPAQIVLLDARQGEIQARFREGGLSLEAWHASGRYFIFAAADPARPRDEETGRAPTQLYAALAEPPYTTSQITFINKGVSGDYAVSRDGAWVAAVARGTKVPTLILLEWAKLDTSRAS